MGSLPATNYPIHGFAKTLGLQVIGNGGVGITLGLVSSVAR
jgi:hypothetical protein